MMTTQPSLLELILSADVIVRGTIETASHPHHGTRVASLRISKTLKGQVEGEVIQFTSDIDHGIRYTAGERVVVFLEPAGGPIPYSSPQMFGAKFRITSFDPTGYDALVSGWVEANALADPVLRKQKRSDVVQAASSSHEKRVRDAVAELSR